MRRISTSRPDQCPPFCKMSVHAVHYSRHRCHNKTKSLFRYRRPPLWWIILPKPTAFLLKKKIKWTNKTKEGKLLSCWFWLGAERDPQIGCWWFLLCLLHLQVPGRLSALLRHPTEAQEARGCVFQGCLINCRKKKNLPHFRFAGNCF